MSVGRGTVTLFCLTKIAIVKKQEKQVLITKSPKNLPFRSELYGKDISAKLLFAIGSKTYRQFIRECEDPELLYEVMILKRNNPKFPTLRKIARITRFAATAASVATIFAGRQISDQVKCNILRMYLPKKQYRDGVQ